MIKLEKHEMNKIEALFKDIEETMIWSCLQGHMGNAWADSNEDPTCAQILTGDFCCYAGDTSSYESRLLVGNIPAFFSKPNILMIPQNKFWGELIEDVHSNRFKKFNRYATKKEKDVFDINKLKGNIDKLPNEFELVPINERLYNQSIEEEWSYDLCSQFLSYSDYSQRGIGFGILHSGKLVSGASSYTIYDEGIEIEIDTRKEYRRMGLAKICASRLIIECLNRGLYPSWDAANKESLALAEKLGYHFDKEYAAYIVEC
ncbi:GNAT family N-acetyltransferase [Acetivibrio cellulolyticus]|uniref:GNAT family N-acetyltransferase n=1 Tax=Acetivibrio cellulolyticus TaxID=35830 RepID=UPI0001E2EB53|nr:GNAT family N-acetyltransferase [Acetivibrio cellulolyticus]